MSDRITQRLPRDDQCEARRTIIAKAAPLSEIVPDTPLQLALSCLGFECRPMNF
jgi:hypothetical protein